MASLQRSILENADFLIYCSACRDFHSEEGEIQAAFLHDLRLSNPLTELLLLGFFEVPVIVRYIPVFDRPALCLLAVIKSHVLQNQCSE
jgi:hypothetical protein